MKWLNARNLLRRRHQKKTPRGAGEQVSAKARANQFGGVRAASICVASGKGGTGKSVVCASLASKLAERGRTLVVDADMGIGNAHIMHGLCPERSFVEFVRGDIALRSAVSHCSSQLDLIAAGSGVSHMAGLSVAEMHLIAAGLDELEPDYNYLLVDSAAGIADQTVNFASNCDVVLVVTTPDVTAMTDAYAFIKVLLRARPTLCPQLVVNRASSFEQARQTVLRMEKVTRRFLGRTPHWIGWIPDDRCVVESVNSRQPVVKKHPASRSGRALERLSVVVLEELDRVRHRGLGRSLMGGVGYSSQRSPALPSR